MFKWLLNLFGLKPPEQGRVTDPSHLPKRQQELCSSERLEQNSLRVDEILNRYEEWSARRAKYIEENQQKLDRGEYTWDDFTNGLADIEEKMLSEPGSRTEINAIVNDLCRAYLAATPNSRRQIQDFVSEGRPLTILIQGLPEKMATEMMSPKDVDKLLCGLAAISIEGGRSDYRDNLTVLAELFVRAEEVGISPKPNFREVAEISSAQALHEGDTPLAETLRNFHKYAIVKERRKGPFA